MLKTISAALLVASMIAAPAMAQGIARTDTSKAAVIKTETPAIKTTAAPVVKPVAAVDSKLQVKPAVRNANAKMMRHHHRHVRPHHRFHKKMGALKTHKIHSAVVKSTVVHIKRG